MAGENQNTGPKPLNQPAVDTQNLRQSLKALLDDQGDYNNLLKQSIADLKKMDDGYSKIEARINALSKDTLNIKQVNQELYRLKQKEELETRKLAVLQKELGDATSDVVKAAKEKAQQDKAFYESQGIAFDLEKEILYNLEQQGNIEAVRLYTQEKQIDIAKKQTELGKEALENEKLVSKQLGISGNFMQKFADKLGVGQEAYAAMVTESRKLVEQNGKVGGFSEKLQVLKAGLKAGADSIKESLSDPVTRFGLVVAGYKAIEAALTKVGNVAKGVATGISDFMSMTGDQVISKMGKGVSDLVSKIPLFGGLLSGLVDGFTTILELSLKEDDKITKIGRELGVSRAEAGQISERFERIATNSGNALISGRGLVESQKELSKELGVTNVLSGEILATNIELGKLAGLDAKTRASIAQSSIITGKSAKSITESVLGQVGALKAATGISFNYQKILSEAANLSGVLGLQFAKYPEKLSNALVTTKAMGLELSKLDSMADTFLDFESSISKEFEAQLLTGKEINLAKAREAFLNNDLATAAAEITRQVGSASEFLSMNRIQQDAIAGAMGMSKNEMADMLKQQEMFAKLGAQDLKSAQARVEELKAEGKTREEISKMIGEDAYQSMVNASAQEKIAGFLEKIQSAVGNFLASSPIVGIINQALDFLSKPESITNIVEKVQGFLATVFDIVGGVAAAIIGIANSWPFNAGIDESILDMALSGGDSIRSMNLTSPVTVSDNVAKNQTSPGTVSSPSGNTLQQTPQTIILNTKNEFTAPGVQTQQIDNNPLNQAVNSPAQIKNTKR